MRITTERVAGQGVVSRKWENRAEVANWRYFKTVTLNPSDV